MQGTFKKTLVSNLHDIADVFGSFNLLGDPGLQRLADKLRAFDNLDVEALRDSEATRQGAVKTAKEILQELDALWIK